MTHPTSTCSTSLPALIAFLHSKHARRELMTMTYQQTQLTLHLSVVMAGDPEESTVNCVDAWVAKLLDGKTLAESEVVQLCSKVCVRLSDVYADS